MATDAPDWTNTVLVITGGGLGQDFPDWTDGIVQITGGQWLTDFPDWTKAEIVAPGGGSGGGGPNPVPGSAFWVDAQSIPGALDGSTVTDWADRSGNLRDATSAGLHRPPTYYSTTAVELINGHPVVAFDNNSSNATTLATQSFAVPLPMTVGVVLQSRGAVVGARNIVGDNVIEEPAFELVPTLQPNIVDGRSSWTAPSGLTAGPHSLIFIYDVNTHVCYVDGTPVTLVQSNPPAANLAIVGGLQLGESGNGGGLYCDMGELLVWPFAFTALQASQQYSYFHIRWGTP